MTARLPRNKGLAWHARACTFYIHAGKLGGGGGGVGSRGYIIRLYIYSNLGTRKVRDVTRDRGRKSMGFQSHPAPAVISNFRRGNSLVFE